MACVLDSLYSVIKSLREKIAVENDEVGVLKMKK